MADPSNSIQEVLGICDSELDVDDLTEVLNEVEPIAAKWNVFGTKLGISPESRESIKKDKGDVQECLLALLTTWLKRNYNCGRHGNPSWRKLAKAVQSLDKALFQRIAANHRVAPPAQEKGTGALAESAPFRSRITVEQCPALGNKVTPAKLLLLNYKSKASGEKQLRILDTISNKWIDIGNLLEITPATLKNYKTTHFGDERECLRSVFGKWIEATSRKYPTTWWGLVKLLDDAELSSIGDELEKVAADDPKTLSV